MEGYRWVYSGRGAWGGMVALSCTGSTAGHSFTSSFFHPFSSSFTHGHPTASGHLLSCQTLRSIYQGPWPLPSHLWVSLCETEPSPTGHWMDLRIPQAKIVHNRGKPASGSLSCLCLHSPGHRETAHRSPPSAPPRCLTTWPGGAASRPPRTAAPGCFRVFPPWASQLPCLPSASSLPALPSLSPAPPGGSSV